MHLCYPFCVPPPPWHDNSMPHGCSQPAISSLFRYRSPRLCCCILDARCDPELHPVPKPPSPAGYQGLYTNKAGKVREGCAVFWRTDRFTLVAKVSGLQGRRAAWLRCVVEWNMNLKGKGRGSRCCSTSATAEVGSQCRCWGMIVGRLPRICTVIIIRAPRPASMLAPCPPPSAQRELPLKEFFPRVAGAPSKYGHVFDPMLRTSQLLPKTLQARGPAAQRYGCLMGSCHVVDRAELPVVSGASGAASAPGKCWSPRASL